MVEGIRKVNGMIVSRLFFSIFFILSGLSLVFSKSAFAEKSFSGPYVGLGLGYGYHHAWFDGISYKGMSLATGSHVGYGWLQNHLYYGLEGGISYDTFSKKKGVSQVKEGLNVGGSLRLGRLLRSTFLPFMRLGVRYDKYALRSLNAKTDHFFAEMLVMGIGVDAFFSNRFSLRSEFDYALCMGLKRAKASTSKKPLHSSLTMGISYHL